jgi:hypothetical protein
MCLPARAASESYTYFYNSFTCIYQLYLHLPAVPLSASYACCYWLYLYLPAIPVSSRWTCICQLYLHLSAIPVFAGYKSVSANWTCNYTCRSCVNHTRTVYIGYPFIYNYTCNYQHYSYLPNWFASDSSTVPVFANYNESASNTCIFQESLYCTC